MAVEDGAHSFSEENRAGPTVRDAHGVQSKMQIADASFEPAETHSGFPLANIEPAQIERGVFVGATAGGIAEKRGQGSWQGKEAGGEEDAITVEQMATEIEQVDI